MNYPPPTAQLSAYQHPPPEQSPQFSKMCATFQVDSKNDERTAHTSGGNHRPPANGTEGSGYSFKYACLFIRHLTSFTYTPHYFTEPSMLEPCKNCRTMRWFLGTLRASDNVISLVPICWGLINNGVVITRLIPYETISIFTHYGYC